MQKTRRCSTITEKNQFVVEGPSTCWNKSKYRDPKNDTLRWEPLVRDYGHDWKPLTWLGFNPDEGVFIGGGPILVEHGFRADPHVFKMSLAAGVATKKGALKGEFNGEYYKWIDGTRVSLYALGSQFELLNFFGFGNEVVPNDSLNGIDFYELEQTQVIARAGIDIPITSSKKTEIRFGAEGQYTTTELAESPFLNSTRPYGIDNMGMIALLSGFHHDSRDNVSAATEGFYFDLGGSWHPEVLDNVENFYTGTFDVRTYLSMNVPHRTTLALRVAGAKNWGTYPYYKSVFIGGSGTLRGFEENRFAGDAALYGSAELRLPLIDFGFLVPGTIGLMGLVDAGRIFHEGEDSETWHRAFGGGLTISFVEPQNVLVISAANSKEKEIAYYIGFGYGF